MGYLESVIGLITTPTLTRTLILTRTLNRALTLTLVLTPQLDRLLVQLAVAAVGAGDQAVPHGLHALLAVRVEEHHDGVPLGVVQGVHCLGGHVQEGVEVLGGGDKGRMA